MKNEVIILTGEKQTGKTTFLQHWVNHRNDIAGFLSPVVDGKRFFYNIRERVLYNMEAGDEEKNVLRVGKFVFSVASFRKMSERLMDWAKETECKYIVLDEIGPLELQQQQGLYKAFIYLLDNAASSLIIVIRESLLEMAADICKKYRRDLKIVYINKVNAAGKNEDLEKFI
jgi:nucleoside-triphosphatase